MNATLDCGARGGVITAIEFASWGTPTSMCGHMATYRCHAGNSKDVVSKLCLGKASCSIPADGSQFENVCENQKRWLTVQVRCSLPTSTTAQVSLPPSATGTLRLPYYATNKLVVTESNVPVFQMSSFVPGPVGVSGAVLNNGVVAVAIQSGNYDFAISGVDGVRVCQKTIQGQTQTLTCPGGTTITYVSFASFGMSNAVCNGTLTTGLECNFGSSNAVVEGLCLGRNSCDIKVSDSVFGINGCGGIKHLISEVYCGVL